MTVFRGRGERSSLELGSVEGESGGDDVLEEQAHDREHGQTACYYISMAFVKKLTVGELDDELLLLNGATEVLAEVAEIR